MELWKNHRTAFFCVVCLTKNGKNKPSKVRIKNANFLQGFFPCGSLSSFFFPHHSFFHWNKLVFFSRFSTAFFRHILNDVCSRECVSEFVEKSFLLRLLCLCVFYVFYVRLFSSFLSTRTKWLLSSLGERRLICHTVGNIIATSLPNGMHSLTLTHTKALSHSNRGALSHSPRRSH